MKEMLVAKHLVASWIGRKDVLTVLSIAIATAAFVCGMSYLAAARASVQWGVALRGLDRCTVYRWPDSPPNALVQVQQALADSVRAVNRSTDEVGSVFLDGRAAGRYIAGIDTMAFSSPSESLHSSDQRIKAGRWLDLDDGETSAKNVVVTEALCRELGKGPEEIIGQKVRLSVERTGMSGIFKVVGVTSALAKADSITIEGPPRCFVPLATFRQRFGDSSRGLDVRFFAKDGVDVEVLGQEIKATAESVCHHPVRVWTPGAIRKAILRDQRSFDLLAYWLAALTAVSFIAVVAGTMLMVHRIQSKEIGLRRSIGATARRIRLELTVVHGGTTAVGAALGACIGSLILVKLSQAHTGADPIMDPYAFLSVRPIVLGGAIAVAVISGLIAALWFSPTKNEMPASLLRDKRKQTR